MDGSMEDSYKDFRYDVAFTLSTNKNKVVKLSDQVNRSFGLEAMRL